jgi:hypothetical protein
MVSSSTERERLPISVAICSPRFGEREMFFSASLGVAIATSYCFPSSTIFRPQRFSNPIGPFLKADGASAGSYQPKRATDTMVELDNKGVRCLQILLRSRKLAPLLRIAYLVGLTDMEELVATVPEKDIASYLREAFVCYGAGAYRGCIVLTHIALFEGLRQKLRLPRIH